MPVEEVLCVPTELFRNCGYFQGFKSIRGNSNYLPLFSSAAQTFRPRNCVEDEPAWKQLIPYIIVERGGQLLNYYRGKGQGEDQGEERLRGKRSIGIGGHINPCDLTEAALGRLADRDEFLDDKYVRGMLRELNEELRFEPQQEIWEIRLLGLINEDETPVGQVHLGVVHVLHTHAECVARGQDVLDLDWNTHPALLGCLEEEDPKADNAFELWSGICLRDVPTARTKRPKQFKGPRRPANEKT